MRLEDAECREIRFQNHNRIQFERPSGLTAAIGKRCTEPENVRDLWTFYPAPADCMYKPGLKGHFFYNKGFHVTVACMGAQNGILSFEPHHFSAYGWTTTQTHHVKSFMTTVSAMVRT